MEQYRRQLLHGVGSHCSVETEDIPDGGGGVTQETSAVAKVNRLLCPGGSVGVLALRARPRQAMSKRRSR